MYYLYVVGFVSTQIPVVFAGTLGYFLGIKRAWHRCFTFSIRMFDRCLLKWEKLTPYPEIAVPHILMLNHLTLFDSLLYHFTPTHCLKFVGVTKSSAAYVPFVGTMFYILDFIFVDKKRKDSRLRCRKEIIAHIVEKKHGVVIFPEGVRNYASRTFAKKEIEFRHGIFEIAVAENIPIVVAYHRLDRRIDDMACTVNQSKTCFVQISPTVFNDNRRLSQQQQQQTTMPDTGSQTSVVMCDNREARVQHLHDQVYEEFARLEAAVQGKIDAEDEREELEIEKQSVVMFDLDPFYFSMLQIPAPFVVVVVVVSVFVVVVLTRKH